VDIVLGVSMTPTTVRMVLVEGEKADGVTVDHDVFDVTATDGSATSSNAAEQVIAAVLGTKESAEAGGHHLKSIGVTWSDHAEASALRDALAARGIDDVMLVSDGHAAAVLAQAVGRAVGYDTTALLFIDRDTATLSVVQTDDGAVVKVLSRTLHSSDAMAVLTEMAAAVDAQDSPPRGMFVVGSGVDVSSVKAHLEHLISVPVSAPDEPELALARGAALASANAPTFEATTVGLAYSQDPDGTTAGAAYPGLSAAETQLAPVSDADPLAEAYSEYPPETGAQAIEEGRKPFLLVGSGLTSIFVVGVVALVISLAVSIRPTVDQRPSPGQSAIVPSTAAPAAPPVREAQPVDAPPPPAETIKAPVPVVQQAPQAPPRTVYVEQPQAPAPAPPPAAPAPAPAAPPPAPAPPVVVPPLIAPPPVIWYPRPRNPWNPPWSPPTPTWTPPKPTWTPPKPTWTAPTWTPPWPQEPQEPQEPQIPQQPQWPQWPGGGSGSGGSGSGGSGSGGSGSGGHGDFESGGSGGSESGRSGGSGGSRGGGSGGNCFLIFCG
jgi:uncharacterized membrane protein YgcG